MHRAKAFFFVSLGVLALAVSYTFGAVNARSQAANQVVIGSVYGHPLNPNAWAIDQQGQIWVWYSGALSGPIATPKPGRVIAFYNEDGGTYWFLYEDGDIYHGETRITNLFANGPVPAQVQTWGRIKADRR